MLPELPPYEKRIFEYDMLLNDRGVRVDRRLLNACRAVATQTNAEIDTELFDLSGAAVQRSSQSGRIATILEDYRIEAPNLSRRSVAALLQETLPGNVRRMLQLRAEGARTSTRKLEAIHQREVDGVLHGMLHYYGAGTGRHSSIGVQLQNLPRPERPWREIQDGIDEMLHGAGSDQLRLLHGAPLGLIADNAALAAGAGAGQCLRSGRPECGGVARLRLADRRAMGADAEAGEDVYCRTAGQVFGREIKKSDERERFLGKTLELAGQYGMGCGRGLKKPAPPRTSRSTKICREPAWRPTAPATRTRGRRGGNWTMPRRARCATRAKPSPPARLNSGWSVAGCCAGCRAACFLFYREPAVLNECIEREDGSIWERKVLTFMGVNPLTRCSGNEYRIWGAALLENVVCRHSVAIC